MKCINCEKPMPDDESSELFCSVLCEAEYEQAMLWVPEWAS